MASPRDVVIIEGVRTPFAKAGSDLKDIHPAELGQIALKELFQRTDLDLNEIDEVI
ncbi:MAG: acetyl-CoA C-acyltransferase, partial [Bdellovibrionales bacterium]|nr:acetyl-CoA C-acyltransferase [Bdellovibrionales bacterium]